MRPTTLLIAASLALAPFASGCDFIEEFWGSPDELSTVRIPVTFTLPERLPIAMPDAVTVAAMPVDANGNRFLATCTTASPDPLDPCLPPVYVGDMNLAELDETGQLASAEGTIDSIEISGVTLNVLENTMNVEMQPIEIRIGGPVADYFTALAAANTPIVPAGTTGPVEGSAVEANRAAVGQELGDFEFGMGMGTTLLIPGDVEPNGGTAQAEVVLSLVIVISLTGE